MAALLGDLSTVSEVVSLRLPALGTLLPDMADGARSLTGVVRGGGLVALVDVYPRLSCDYGVPHRPPTQGGSPPPALHNHCTQSGPTLQQRGSANAPRPGGEVAGAPAASSATTRQAQWLEYFLTVAKEGR